MSKIRNSWNLIKASASVLRADKELIIFPIVSSIGVLLATATFAFPLFLVGFFDSLVEGEAEILAAVVAFVYYIVQYTIIIFANSALIGAAMIRLRGGNPTVGDGLRIAFEHLFPILGYALLSATVGMIMNWLSERGNRLGRFAATVAGMAWNLATYLVVPILVIEDVGPWEAVKRSANLLKKTWGEQIAGNFGIGAIFWLVAIAIVVLSFPAFYVAISAESVVFIALLVLILVLTLTFLGLIQSALNGIYVAAVYRYAAEGETGGFFDEEMVKGAFRLAKPPR